MKVTRATTSVSSRFMGGTDELEAQICVALGETEVELEAQKENFDHLTVGELREMMVDLPGDTPVHVDYDALVLRHKTSKPAVLVWGAYSGPDGLVIVR